MIVKYIKKKEIEKSGYAFTQIVAEKADGTTYTKDFFANDDKMNAKLEDFDPGDFMLLTYENNKYKNLKDIKPADGFAKADYQKGVKSNTKTASGSSGGNFRGEDTNRSAAIYLAKEVVLSGLNAGDDGVDTVLSEMFTVADKINMYITSGINPLAKDGLEVPDIEEED